MFGEYADRYASRPGGYTRVIKAGRRAGDNAPMAIIELVGDAEEAKASDLAVAEEESAVDVATEEAAAEE